MPREIIARWRRDSIAVVTNPDSSASLRALAWAFLRQHGATTAPGAL